MVSQPVSLGSPNDFGPAVKVVRDHGVYMYKFAMLQDTSTADGAFSHVFKAYQLPTFSCICPRLKP